MLSDYTNLQNRDSSATQEPEKLLVQQHDNLGDEDLNDAYVGGDENMPDSDSGSSEDELLPETNGLASASIENGDLGRILLELRGTHQRYQVRRLLFRNCCTLLSKVKIYLVGMD